MPNVPQINVPSGGAWGYAPTLDALADSATHQLQLGSVASLRGTLAQRPSAAAAGVNALYYATDTNVLYYSDGTTWSVVTLNPNVGSSPGISSVSLSKCIVAGHSYNMIVQNVMGAGYNPNGFFTNGGSLVDRGQWPCMVQDVLGIAADRKYLFVDMPNTGGGLDYTTYVAVEEDCFVEAASYFPNFNLGVSGVNYRNWTISVPTGPSSGAWQQIGCLTTQSGGQALTAGLEAAIIDLCEVTPQVLGANQQQAYHSGVGFGGALWAGSTVCPGGQSIRIQSLHVGAGAIDSGGTIVLRLGGRFRNYSVGGSQLVQSGVYIGGWATSMNPFWNPRAMLPQNSALPANLTAKFPSTQTTAGGTISTVGSTVTVASTADFPANGTFSLWTVDGAFTVTYTGGGGGGTTFTGCTIGAGSHVYNSGFQACATSVSFESLVFGTLGGFIQGPNGTVATITTVFLFFGSTTANTAATAPATGGDHGTIAAGLQAQIIATAPSFGFETPTGHALAILLTGINDAGANTTFDIVAYREALRSWAAFHSCSGFWSLNNLGAFSSNVVTSNGSGTWTLQAAPAWGQYGGGLQRFTGTPNASSKVTISLGIGFSGGPVDLFFMSWAGTADGGTASITVDGATPPQGAVTVVTTGACPLANQISAPWSATGTTTLTRTAGSFTRDDVGKKVVGAGIPNSTFIQSFTDSTHVVCNNVINAGSGTASLNGGVMMVKRLTGLSATSHTIEITVTGMFATDGSAEFAYWGYGLEPKESLLNPVILCNVPRILSTYSGFDPNPNVITINAEYPKVVNGTATVVAGNTSEPALPSSVQVCDIDTAINHDAKFFCNDGLHVNTYGHAKISDAILTTIRTTVTNIQTLAR